MKKAYKESKRPMGVYAIRNNVNGIVHIGSGIDVEARINRHRTELRFGSHRNKDLQKEWNAVGELSFQFEVLDELKLRDDTKIDPLTELQVLTDMWIRKLQEEGYRVVSL